MDLKTLSEKDLIIAYNSSKNHDREKIGKEIYQRYKLLIYKFSHKFNESLKPEAKSVATEKMFLLLKKFDSSNRTKFSTFFHSHLNYLAKDIYRKNFPLTISDYSWKKNKENRQNNFLKNFSSTILNNPKYKNKEYQLLENEEINQKLEEIFKTLDNLEKSVIKMYFGFGGINYSKKEISKQLNITLLSVNKTLKKSLEKISEHKHQLYIPENND